MSVRELAAFEVDRRGYTAFQNVYVFRHLQIGDGAPPCPVVGESLLFRGSERGSFDMSGTVLAVSSCRSEKLNLVVVGMEWEKVDTSRPLAYLRDTLAGIEASDREQRADARRRRAERSGSGSCQVRMASWELQEIRKQIYVSAKEMGEDIYRNRTISAAMLSWWRSRNHEGLVLLALGMLGVFAGLHPDAFLWNPIAISVAGICGMFLACVGIYRFLGERA